MFLWFLFCDNLTDGMIRFFLGKYLSNGKRKVLRDEAFLHTLPKLYTLVTKKRGRVEFLTIEQY